MSDRETQEPSEGEKSNQQSHNDSQKEEGGETNRDGRKQQKEYFKEELKRLKDSLNKESSKIKRPPHKKHTPDTFNTLQPYYNTHTAAYLIELPDEVRHSYLSRQTALGLTDPWVDHTMDHTILPKIDSRPVAKQEGNKKKKGGNKERPPKSGSTRLPKFPAVEVPAGELTTRTLYYSDVPALREELKKKYTDNSDAKVQSEYTRTKKDFYRMELDKMGDYHPSNRKHMRACYFAYLQNNKGSKKAIYECVKTVEKEEEEEEQAEGEQEETGSMRSQQQQQQAVEASA